MLLFGLFSFPVFVLQVAVVDMGVAIFASATAIAFAVAIGVGIVVIVTAFIITSTTGNAAIIHRHTTDPNPLRVRAPTRFCHEAFVLGQVGVENVEFGVGTMFERGEDAFGVVVLVVVTLAVAMAITVAAAVAFAFAFAFTFASCFDGTVDVVGLVVLSGKGR